MPIHLKAPTPTRPVDGRGWNRLSLNAHIGPAADQCALKPRNFTSLYESQDTRRARWGLYGPCVTGGQCDTCPLLSGPQARINALDTRVLARIHPHDGHVYVVGDPDRGWASGAIRYTWSEIARLDGWELGRRHFDEHGEGFWLNRC